MAEEERAKTAEALQKALIQVQTGDIEVAKLQLAARWAEMSIEGNDLSEWLTAFGKAFKSIDETLRT